jgi:hypothetical protein
MTKENKSSDSSPEWMSITTSLAITGSGLDASAIDRTLDVTPLVESVDGASVHCGPGWWAYSLDERCSGDLGEQLSALTSHIGPRLGTIRALLESGYSVQVAIAGTVQARNRLTLSAQSADQLAALGLPVSFTTLMEDNSASEDPLGWLD